MKGILLGENPQHFQAIFAHERWNKLKETIEISETVYSQRAIRLYADEVKDAQIAFATWNCPVLTEEEIRTYLPQLKIIFYAAASVNYFAPAYLQCGIRIITAASAMAAAVAEFTVGEIYHANKGVYRYMRNYSSLEHQNQHESVMQYPGNYQTKVGILGAGMIGSLVINMLNAFSNMEIMVYDPFLDEKRAESLHVSKNSLTEIFSQCQTISNHIADNEFTKNIINKSLFSIMKDNVTFINTGRGAQVNHDDLLAALLEEPDRTALLDVTYPEPLPQGHPLLSLSNVFITPHMAGTSGNDIVHMTDFLIQQLLRYQKNLPLIGEVTSDMLPTMA